MSTHEQINETFSAYEGGLDPDAVPKVFHDSRVFRVPGGVNVEIVNEGPVPAEYQLDDGLDGGRIALVGDTAPEPSVSPKQADRLAPQHMAKPEKISLWRRTANFLGSLVIGPLGDRPQHMAKTSHYGGLAKGQAYAELLGKQKPTFVSDMEDATRKIKAAEAAADAQGLPRQESRAVPLPVRVTGEKWNTDGSLEGIDFGKLTEHRVNKISRRWGP